MVNQYLDRVLLSLILVLQVFLAGAQSIHFQYDGNGNNIAYLEATDLPILIPSVDTVIISNPDILYGFKVNNYGDALTWTGESNRSWVETENKVYVGTDSLFFEFYENIYGLRQTDRSPGLITLNANGAKNLPIQVVVIADIELPLGLSENGGHLIVYPNPSNSLISISNNNEIIKKINLFDLKGNSIDEFVVDAVAAEMDIRHVKPGVYLLKLTLLNNQVVDRKLVIIP